MICERDCEVRSAQPEDLPRLIDLLKATELFWESGDTIDGLQNKLRHDPESILVLQHKNTVIGMAMFIFDPWCSFLWHVAIDPAYQKNGLANLLVGEAERRLQARGTNCLAGYVYPTNQHSRSFFAKRGYLSLLNPVIPLAKDLKKVLD